MPWIPLGGLCVLSGGLAFWLHGLFASKSHSCLPILIDDVPKLPRDVVLQLLPCKLQRCRLLVTIFACNYSVFSCLAQENDIDAVIAVVLGHLILRCQGLP